MSVLRALTEHFVAPAEEGRPSVVRAEPVATAIPPGVGLLCPPRQGRTAGSAVGQHLARRRRAPAALVAVWTGDDPSSAAGGTVLGREARRLVRALGERDLAAHASGRVVVVALPAAPDIAAAAASQAFAVAAALPTVLVLAGPRDERLDALLEQRDLVLVADAGDGLVADAAVQSLQRRGVAARRCALPAPTVTAVAARGGGLLPSARRGLDTALEGLA